MTSLNRHHQVPSSNALLMRIFERPELVSAVRELPAPVLGKLIDRVGLEDAGELVALASTAQLERMFDDDLWQAASAGEDEAFRPDRFALWLRVMHEGGEEFVIQRLCELPQDLLALAIHRLVLVVDTDELAEHFTGPSDELDQLERALESAVSDEWEEFRVIARDSSAWDDVWAALIALDRDHHDRLRALLEQCCAMTTEFINGQGTLYDVLTSDEMLENDVAAAREDRRAAEGFVSPADARSFLELARRREGLEERDPIARAYFRDVAPAQARQVNQPEVGSRGSGLTPARADVNRLVQLLEEAEVVTPANQQPLAALTAGPERTRGGAGKSKSKGGKTKRTAPLFEAAMASLRESDPQRFSERVEELGFLVNVLISGSEREGRRPRPMEAVETVLKTCEAGLRSQCKTKTVKPEQALDVLTRISADRLFRYGFASEG
jgi:Family of unknown function (DUF6178)